MRVVENRAKAGNRRYFDWIAIEEKDIITKLMSTRTYIYHLTRTKWLITYHNELVPDGRAARKEVDTLADAAVKCMNEKTLSESLNQSNRLKI